MLSSHPWPSPSVRPTSASRRSHWIAKLPLCLLQASSTSAGPPILYGRLRPMAGARPTGTERCRDARTLRAQRQGSFWCSERGCGAERRPSQRPLGEAQAPQARSRDTACALRASCDMIVPAHPRGALTWYPSPSGSPHAVVQAPRYVDVFLRSLAALLTPALLACISLIRMLWPHTPGFGSYGYGFRRVPYSARMPGRPWSA